MQHSMTNWSTFLTTTWDKNPRKTDEKNGKLNRTKTTKKCSLFEWVQNRVCSKVNRIQHLPQQISFFLIRLTTAVSILPKDWWKTVQCSALFLYAGCVGTFFETQKGSGSEITSDRSRYFSNRSDIYKVAKVVHGNQSDNCCNRSAMHGCPYYYQNYATKHPVPFPA